MSPLPTLSVAHEVRDRAEEFRIIGERDWWITRSGNYLHSAQVDYYSFSKYGNVGGRGITACGRRTELWIPGIFSRMGLLRCSRCCRILGYPEGRGSPKNDERCRLLVEKRLAGQR